MPSTESPSAIITKGKLILTFFYLLFFPALLLFLSGNWLWPEGWIFGIWFLVMCISTILYLYKNDPALLSERYKQPGEGGQKGWDIFVVVGLFIGFITWIISMPLDAVRFALSPAFPVYVKCIGFLMLSGSFFFFYRSYADNTYLSPLVRIQTERKHQLVTTGVYGLVRHPMYLGALLMFLGGPLLLNSFLGILAGSCLIILLAFRTLGEEKMLEKEFASYTEYKKMVKYRFVPFIW